MSYKKPLAVAVGALAAFALIPVAGAGAAVLTTQQVNQITHQAAVQHNPKLLNQLDGQQTPNFGVNQTMKIRTTTITLKDTTKVQSARAGCEAINGQDGNQGAYGLTYKKNQVKSGVIRDLYEGARVADGGMNGWQVNVKAKSIPKDKIKLTVATVCYLNS